MTKTKEKETMMQIMKGTKMKTRRKEMRNNPTKKMRTKGKKRRARSQAFSSSLKVAHDNSGSISQ